MYTLSALVLSALVLAALACTPAVLARVNSMSAPPTVYSGQNFTATLEIQSYIQNWDDFGVVWGLKGENLNTCQECIGAELSYNDLYGDDTLGNQTFSVPIPEGYAANDYTLVAMVPYLVGVSGETGIRYFNQSITVQSPSPAERCVR